MEESDPLQQLLFLAGWGGMLSKYVLDTVKYVKW